LIAESAVGASVAVTRQKAGSPVIFWLVSGVMKTPLVMSVADVIVVSSSASVCRLVHGVAMAGVPNNAIAARRPAAAPVRDRRYMGVLPMLFCIGRP
jgi:hypothetical protein